jgi:hypothetical protein
MVVFLMLLRFLKLMIAEKLKKFGLFKSPSQKTFLISGST